MPKRKSADRENASEGEGSSRRDDTQEPRPKRALQQRIYRQEEESEEETEEVEGASQSRRNKRKQPRDGAAVVPRKRSSAAGDVNSEFDFSQQRDFSLTQGNKEAEVGTIEKVSLRNFMCHTRLDINFGPHVNFIVGRNGSGKSAIVTGLVVGLGGKAIVTNRSHSVKSFIKSGKQSAEVEVHLRNRGNDAYKPEAYGSTIIVSRKFNSDGSSKYCLKSQENRVVSEKRDELTHILDSFNIQVDNPVAILNQDTSRNFLNSKSPQDRYKFFLKATLLEQLVLDYKSAMKHVKETELIMQQKKRAMKTHKQEVKEWEQKFKALDTVEELRASVRRLQKEMAWAIVCEKERELEPLQKRLEKETNRLPAFQQKVEESKTKTEELTAKLTGIQEKIIAVNDEIKQLAPEVEIHKKKCTEEKDLLRKKQNKMRGTESDLRNAKHERDQYLERIADMKKSANKDYEAARQKRQADIEALAQRLQTQEAKKTTLSHELEQFHSCLIKYRDETANLVHEEQMVQKQITQLRHQVQNLQSARGDRLRSFGNYIPEVLQDIRDYSRRGAFKHDPIGPLGANFQLRDQKWALAVEVCLKSLVNSFCVDNHKDMKTLETIFTNRIRDARRPSIIVRKFKDNMHDVSRERVRSSTHPCLLDLLHFDDPNVANVLIDQRGIENVIFIADSVEARRVMQNQVPEKCKEAFTLTGDQIQVRPTFRYYSSNQDRARVLTINVEEQIKHCQAEMQRHEARQKEIVQRRTNLQVDIRKNQQEERHAQKQLEKIGESITKYQCEIRELRSVEDPAPVDVTTLEEEVENLNQQIGELEQSLTGAKEEVALQDQKFRQAESVYKGINRDRQQKLEIADPLKEEQERISTDIHLAKGHLKHYESKLKEYEKHVQEQRKNLEKYQQELQVSLEKAGELEPERIKTRRTASNIDGEITQILKRIRIEERTRGDPKEITKKYYEVKEKYDAIEASVRQNENFLSKLKSNLEVREKHFTDFRGNVAVRVRYLFIVYLNNRNYTGKIMFKHDSQALDMTVSPQSKDSASVSDLKALSGGERSFATVCFILALWDAMESPFRCLDEFDVFMDMVNRRISMDMMMQVADSQTERQFIFLTPQDMTQMRTKNSYKIFRMPDPDRASTRGVRQRETEEED